ncbi:tryptophan 7-halogenase [Streptomyces sp. NPDC004838]
MSTSAPAAPPVRGTRSGGRFEAVVAGGGPAGSVAALVLARAGRRVLLVDRAGPEHRAFKVGETLPPAARPLLTDLGLWASFSAGGHLRCTGTYASWGSGELHGRSHLYDPHGHGWHLDRDLFDAFLRNAAVAAGARLHRGEVVRHLADERGVLIRNGGVLERVGCRWVVDATGRRAVIGRRRARRIGRDRLVAAYALLGHRLPGPPDRPDSYAGPAPDTSVAPDTSSPAETASASTGRRAWRAGNAGHASDTESDTELRTLVEAVPGGWWYTVRVPAGRLVAHLTDADLCGAALRTPGGFLGEIARTRHIGRRVGGYDPARVPVPRWSPAHGLRLSPPWGRGWVAAGDAAVAFDPLSSQGILTALHTGARAGHAIDVTLAGGTGALPEYAAFVARVAEAYDHHRAEAYAREQRWPQAPFWRRRHEAG